MPGQASSQPPVLRLLHETHASRAVFARTTADLIFVLDAEGRYVDVLAFHGDPLHRQAEELKDRHVYDFLPQAVAELILASIREALRVRVPQLLEYPLRLEDDSHWFEGHVTPLIDARGECSRVLWVARDITERKGTEESLRRTQDDLEERVRQRTAELARAQLQLRCEIVEHRRTETQLLEEQRRLRQLLDTYERYRQWAVREIHAGVAQPLQTALNCLESLGQPGDPEASPPEAVQEPLRRRLHAWLQEASQAMNRLHPSLLYTEGLRGAIERLLRESHRTGSARVSLVYEIPGDRLLLPLETTIFRIVQDSLALFSEHCQNDLLELSLRPYGDQLHIRLHVPAGRADLARVAGEQLVWLDLQDQVRLFDGKAVLDITSEGGVHLLIALPLVVPLAER